MYSLLPSFYLSERIAPQRSVHGAQIVHDGRQAMQKLHLQYTKRDRTSVNREYEVVGRASQSIER